MFQNLYLTSKWVNCHASKILAGLSQLIVALLVTKHVSYSTVSATFECDSAHRYTAERSCRTSYDALHQIFNICGKPALSCDSMITEIAVITTLAAITRTDIP